MQNPFGNGMIPLPSNVIVLKKGNSQNVRIGKVGFSISALLFHWLPSILRSDMYNFLCILGVDAIIWMAVNMFLRLGLGVDPSSTFTYAYIIGSIIWGLIYNRMYIVHLIKNGYKPADKRSANLLKKAGYIKK
ncbi:hypothetical protein DY130_04735 [Apilactobacillus micheneri]|uniref:DUF2628 domain-containing protein n=1 Tax=Apilactobacillus micheneri TaxID=1899430 RepID=A0A9Q8IN93_9LACO|nr:hypothetical protein [Apilactobacillus micheneri]TPR39821.1 hypothetical protein DY121_04740 [Apilactobacillus micheneri]TPR43742.1 hypothetical protein DY130_04735 [Apilactobacillus micheneri]TPR45295.1 hypothetical protein DY128_04735 [Apilactobacillus micheneri]